jgi:hypothetical protein
MPLEHGLMGVRMRECLATSPQEPCFVSMVLVCKHSCWYGAGYDGQPSLQKFADALDVFDKWGSFEHRDRDFVWEYLGGPNIVTDPRMTVLNLPYWDKCTTPARMDVAVHVLLRYRLLDILADVLGCEKHPEKKLFAQLPLPSLPNRVESVS